MEWTNHLNKSKPRRLMPNLAPGLTHDMFFGMENIDNAIDQLVTITLQAFITSNSKLGYIELALTKLANLESELQNTNQVVD